MKTITFIVTILLMPFIAKSQDIIIKKNGDDIKTKIVEITKDEIKYKKFENLEGPVYSISIAETFMIRYQNGTKETFLSDENKELKKNINNENQLIPAGTLIKFKSKEKVKAKKVKEDDEITFELSEQIVVNNVLVVNKGATVYGTFTNVTRSAAFGKEGALEFKVSHLFANNGTKIKLTSDNKIAGINRTSANIAGAILFSPLYLMARGTDAVIKKDQEFKAYVDKN